MATAAQRATISGLALCIALAASTSVAQQTTFELDPERGTWVESDAAEPGTDAWVIAETRRALAADRPGEARTQISDWIETYERTDNPWLPEAYMLRGDALVALGKEYKALYDYERVALNYPQSEVFLPTLERELRVGRMYLNGLKRKFLFIRFEDATPIGIELLMRIQERSPGSRLAETAALDLADYFYRVRELELAAEMYGIFLVNYPRSQEREHAMLRQIYANVAQFKGPRYDASSLVEARALIGQFEDEYPDRAEQLGITDALIARLDESAAAQMLATTEWYLRRDDQVSARFTLRRLVIKHDGTVAAARGRDMLEARGWPFPEAVSWPEEIESLREESGGDAANAPADESGTP